MTLKNKMTVYLGKRRVDLMHLGRAHTAGDIVEFHSACYCGDAHLRDWPITLDRIAEFQPRALAPAAAMRW